MGSSENGRRERTQSGHLPWRPGSALLIFGAWTLFATLISASVIFDASGPPRNVAIPVVRVVFAFVEAYLWAALTLLIFWLVRRYATERYHPLVRLGIFAGVGLVLPIAVAGTIQMLRESFSTADIAQPYAAVSAVGIAVQSLTYIAVLIAGFARHYLMRFQDHRDQAIALQAQTVQLQAQLAEARLTALRAQLNPHFLFNTLHAISALTERDPRGVRRMLSGLSGLLRIALNEMDGPEIPLRRELVFVRQYLELMRIQLQSSIEITEDIDATALDALVPTFILQPLIENAIKHGISKISGPGRLTLTVRRTVDKLNIAIINNGPKLASGEPLKEGVGLRNTRERLVQLYGEDQGLLFRAGAQDDGGFRTEVTFPFHKTDLQGRALIGSGNSHEQ